MTIIKPLTPFTRLREDLQNCLDLIQEAKDTMDKLLGEQERMVRDTVTMLKSITKTKGGNHNDKHLQTL